MKLACGGWDTSPELQGGVFQPPPHPGAIFGMVAQRWEKGRIGLLGVGCLPGSPGRHFPIHTPCRGPIFSLLQLPPVCLPHWVWLWTSSSGLLLGPHVISGIRKLIEHTRAAACQFIEQTRALACSMNRQAAALACCQARRRRRPDWRWCWKLEDALFLLNWGASPSCPGDLRFSRRSLVFSGSSGHPNFLSPYPSSHLLLILK